jgi:hypothetical protein
MKIIDPAVCPDNFGPLLFEPLDEHVSDGGVFALTVGGTCVGELASGGLGDGAPLVLDDPEAGVTKHAGRWHLQLADVDGRVTTTHILCVAPAFQPKDQVLTSELAVWATLTVLWTATSRVCQRG